MSFVDFIIKNPTNKRYLWIALACSIIQFIIFKYLYPFPDFFSDSYSYIRAAKDNLNISIWPIGYSKFLRWFHFITHSDTTLVTFQYFFVELSFLYFFFTFGYFFQPNKINQNILFIFLFLNPLFLYLCNYVNSDPLFLALSICWFTQLIWVIYRPSIYLVFTQAILIFIAFTVRNNAYYYPIVSTISFLFSGFSAIKKLAGIALPILFIVPFILYTRKAAKELTGTSQFSLFTGWQLANNALYMRDHLSLNSAALPTVETKELDTLATYFYQRVPPFFEQYLSEYTANYFIRNAQSPLKRYFRHHYKPTDGYGNVVAWGKCSIVFESYGKWLIIHYPIDYFRYFMLHNIKNYFLPPLEKLEIYNTGEDSISKVAQQWFDFRGTKINSISKDFQGYLLILFPSLFMISNLYFIGSIIFFIYKHKLSKNKIEFSRTALLLIIFQLLNFCFCVSVTVIVFRYQVFPLILTIIFPLLIMESTSKKEARQLVKIGLE